MRAVKFFYKNMRFFVVKFRLFVSASASTCSTHYTMKQNTIGTVMKFRHSFISTFVLC